MELTVFVIDDDPAARDSLVFLLRANGLTSRAYGSATEFLGQLRPDQNGCIVTDVRMPEMDGMELVHALKRRHCLMPIIIITGHADVQLAIQAMRAGVSDFIEKPFASEAILEAVRAGLERAHSAGASEACRLAIERRKSSLTDRERQVLELLADGLTNKEIGRTLDISPRTVEIHRANLMAKMKADRLSKLVRMALSTGA